MVFYGEFVRERLESEFQQRQSLEQFQDDEPESRTACYSTILKKFNNMVRLEDIFEAYYDCRRRKRRSADSLGFEVDYERNLVALCDEINAHQYRPSPSVTFVVNRPLYREVFAAAFRDRVVHHYIALRLEPILERQFSDRTFNCRRGKGAFYGIEQLDRDIKECSSNYTDDCYVLKMDIKSFFMSIPKDLLNKRMDKFIVDNYSGEDKEDLRYLSAITILHHPEENCEKHSPDSLWEFLPKNKSLFTNEYNRGLAIGNLTSQLDANFFMDPFDHWLEDVLGFPYHGRYVDDFYIVDKSKDRLVEVIPIIRKKLKEDFKLTLHPDKVYLQHYSKGIKFTGSVVKPGRIYVGNRTISSFKQLINRMNHFEGNITMLRSCVAGLNSYFGLMVHADSYALRRRIARMISPECWKYIYVSGHFDKFVLKKRYCEINGFMCKIKKGGENAFD